MADALIRIGLLALLLAAPACTPILKVHGVTLRAGECTTWTSTMTWTDGTTSPLPLTVCFQP